MSKLKNVPNNESESFLTELRRNQQGYLHCVKAVKDKYNLGLRDAAEVVLNSQAFADRRDESIDNQNALEFESFEAWREDNNLKSIQTTFIPNNTVYRIETNSSEEKNEE